MGETAADDSPKKRGRAGKAEPVAKKAKTDAPAAAEEVAAPAKRGRGRPPKNGVKAKTPKKVGLDFYGSVVVP